MLARLRAEVRALEGNSIGWCAKEGVEGRSSPPFASASPGVAPATGWTFGESAFDACLPSGQLDPGSFIEVKPAEYLDWPATLAFIACLAVRRQLSCAARGAPSRPVLWCTTSHLHNEHGRLYGPGLSELGLSPDAVIAVDAPREVDALWTLEEGLRAGALSLAIGLLEEVDLTPSRRLGLAAAAGETPLLLVTSPSAPPAPSATLRFRLQRMPAASDPLGTQAPGRRRMRLTLERCRGAPPTMEARSFDLEWCDVTYRFRVVSNVADRSYAAPQAVERA